MERVAQTNLQLYDQLLGSGLTVDQVLVVRRAYQLLCSIYSGHYQADGKPFVCHGVGVASLIANLDVPPDFISVALLHNVYGNGDFGDGRTRVVTERRRAVVREAVGGRIAELIEEFGSFRIRAGNIDRFIADAERLSATERTLLAIDLADTAEKYVDLGALYFGDGTWIAEAERSLGDRQIELAHRIGYPALADRMRDLFRHVREHGATDPRLRWGTQKYLALDVPRSCRRRRLPFVLATLHRWGNGLYSNSRRFGGRLARRLGLRS